MNRWCSQKSIVNKRERRQSNKFCKFQIAIVFYTRDEKRDRRTNRQTDRQTDRHSQRQSLHSTSVVVTCKTDERNGERNVLSNPCLLWLLLFFFLPSFRVCCCQVEWPCMHACANREEIMNAHVTYASRSRAGRSVCAQGSGFF